MLRHLELQSLRIQRTIAQLALDIMVIFLRRLERVLRESLGCGQDHNQAIGTKRPRQELSTALDSRAWFGVSSC